MQQAEAATDKRGTLSNEEALLANYHAHNATSRSHELPVPLLASLLLSSSSSEGSSIENQQQREDVNVPGTRAFTVREFLTKEECDFFIKTTIMMGYEEHSDVGAE